jgi:hypothetical protein
LVADMPSWSVRLSLIARPRCVGKILSSINQFVRSSQSRASSASKWFAEWKWQHMRENPAMVHTNAQLVASLCNVRSCYLIHILAWLLWRGTFIKQSTRKIRLLLTCARSLKERIKWSLPLCIIRRI